MGYTVIQVALYGDIVLRQKHLGSNNVWLNIPFQRHYYLGSMAGDVKLYANIGALRK